MRPLWIKKTKDQSLIANAGRSANAAKRLLKPQQTMQGRPRPGAGLATMPVAQLVRALWARR
jgi:hypothetical protein